MGSVRTILFLCPHNAAKSVLAAAYFDQLARDRGLDFRAASAGTSPDAAPSPVVVALLRDEGIDVAGHRPRRLTTEDLTSAQRVVSLGCDLADLDGGSARVDCWDDVPPASRDLGASRAAIKRHLAELVNELAAGDEPLTPEDLLVTTMRQPTAVGFKSSDAPPAVAPACGTLRQLTSYFLTLGTIGFGGPVALVGYMQRDLVERRRWIDDEEYKLGLALAQIMPGPLAAQLAIAIGYFAHGVLGATLVGLAFVLPSFLMVLALSALYVAFGGLWWMQAVFYGVSAAVIGIIAIAAYKLARKVNGRDPLLWGIFAVTLRRDRGRAGRAGGVLPRGRHSGAAGESAAIVVAGSPPVFRSESARHRASVAGGGGRHRRSDECPLGDPALLHQGRGVCLRQRPGHRAVPL